MSYTITISGLHLAGDGQTQEQADAEIAAKARSFVAGLQGVSAAYIQTMSGGMASLTAEPQAAAAAEPSTQEGALA